MIGRAFVGSGLTVAVVAWTAFGLLLVGEAAIGSQERPVVSSDRQAAEEERRLAARLAASPGEVESGLRLARLQEGRGASAEAEATLLKLRDSDLSSAAVLQALAGLYQRVGRVDRAIDTLERAADRDPSNAPLHHLIATSYLELSKNRQLDVRQKQAHLRRAAAAEDLAIAVDPRFFEALVYKSLLMRELAAQEADATSRQALIDAADALAARAASVRGKPADLVASGGDLRPAPYPPPPPPPPVPGAGEIQWAYGETTYVASGNSRPLEKVKDVSPVYPPMAIKLGVQGRVVVEALVNPRGEVTTARIVESVPLLNQSAIDAVKQWRFDPATATSATGRIVLTVTATFTPPR